MNDPPSGAIQPSLDHPDRPALRSDAIQIDLPPYAPAEPKKWSLKGRILLGLGAFCLLYVLGVMLGLVPNSRVYTSVGGRTVVIYSYHAGVLVRTSGDQCSVETGGQGITIDHNTVHLGSGRTMAIPPWCERIEVSVKRGVVAVTFVTPD